MEPAPIHLPPGAARPYLGVLAAALLGMAGKYLLAVPLFIYFSAQILYPAPFALDLDVEGLTFRTVFKKHHYRWDEVGDFTVRSVRVLGITLGRTVAFRVRGRSTEQALPETYRLSPQELAALLNRYRAAVLPKDRLLN